MNLYTLKAVKYHNTTRKDLQNTIKTNHPKPVVASDINKEEKKKRRIFKSNK